MAAFKIFLVICIISVVSCDKDEQLTFTKTPFEGDMLRLDGFYYLDDSSGLHVPVYFFFRNGILMHSGAYKPDNFELVEKSISETRFKEQTQIIPWMWGLFDVRNDSILFERWYPDRGPRRVGLRSGKIINDTTFVITLFESLDGADTRMVHEIYRFRKTSHKPDSVSPFIK